MQIYQVAAHFERNHRDRENQSDPQATRHVDQFGVGARVGRHGFRFERHPADRTITRPHLPDLRMHRAGVDRASRRGVRHRRDRLRLEIPRRLRDEFLAAFRRAEEVLLAGILGRVLGGGGIDLHSADGIACFDFRRDRCGLGCEEARGVCDEILAATVAAEIEGRARMLGRVLGRGGIHRHAADGIARMALRQRRLEHGHHGMRR